MSATARRVPSAWGAVLAGAAPPSLLLGEVPQRFPCLPLTARGHSSVGRAFGLHPKGRRFESGWLHWDGSMFSSKNSWTRRPFRQLDPGSASHLPNVGASLAPTGISLD